jgi:hypothetical protein
MMRVWRSLKYWLLGFLCGATVACAHTPEDVRRYKASDYELLVECLHDKDSNVRRAAAERLGEVSDQKAVPSLVAALKDPHRLVRAKAASALGNIGDASAVPALIEAVRSPDGETSGQAALALGRMRGKATAAIPTLLEVFPESPVEERKIEETAPPQHLTGTFDFGGASITAPMVSTSYIIRTVEVPAAARALEAITGIDIADGGTSRASWRTAIERRDRNTSQPR